MMMVMIVMILMTMIVMMVIMMVIMTVMIVIMIVMMMITDLIMMIIYSNQQGFGSILDLVPLAESVIKLSAVCMHCFGEGSFTKRFGSETEVCLLNSVGFILISKSNIVLLNVKLEL